jgi:uncharacterized protein (TIGR03067 family)
LQGTWALVSIAEAGKPQRAHNLRWHFSANNLAIIDDGNMYHWTVTLAPDASPKALDTRTPSGETAEDLLLKAIYRLDGDRLEVCYNGQRWLDRPREMTGRGAGHFLLVFKRVKR